MQIEATEQAKVSHTALEERLDDNPNPQAAKILAQDAVALKIANAQSEHSRKDIHASEQAIRLLLQPIRFENSQLFEGLTKTRSGINLTGKVFRDVQMQTTLFTQNKPNRLEECLVTARACLGI